MNTLKVIYVSFLALTANSLLAAVVFKSWGDTILYQPFKDEMGIAIELRKCPADQDIKSYRDCPLEEGVSPVTITDTEDDLISGLEYAARNLSTSKWYPSTMTTKIRLYQNKRLHRILWHETKIKSSLAEIQAYMNTPGYYATHSNTQETIDSLKEELANIEQELIDVFKSTLASYPTGQWTNHHHYYAEFKAAVQEIELIIKTLALEITSPDVITYNSQDEAQKLKTHILKNHYENEKRQRARESLMERRWNRRLSCRRKVNIHEMISIYKYYIINETTKKSGMLRTIENEPFREYNCD